MGGTTCRHWKGTGEQKEKKGVEEGVSRTSQPMQKYSGIENF